MYEVVLKDAGLELPDRFLSCGADAPVSTEEFSVCVGLFFDAADGDLWMSVAGPPKRNF